MAKADISANARNLDHIGIIVPDLEASMAMFETLLGVAPKLKELPDLGLRIAEFQAKNIGIELLCYSGEAKFARDTMGDVMGLNHIAIEVDDVAAARDHFAAQGLTPQPGFPRQGAHGEVLFFDRVMPANMLIELCKPDSAV